MNIQYFTVQNERFAILPALELEELLQDQEDIASADLLQAKLANGEEELIPAAYAERLIFGENPITVWREYRGLKQKELADSADVSTSFLSRLEAGQTEASVKTLYRIAQVLNVTLDDLFMSE